MPSNLNIAMAGLFVSPPAASPWQEEEELTPVPLLGVALSITVRNFIAEVELTQRFRNQETRPLEVTYRFPVEEEAAVTGCTALLGDQTIVARVQENRRAERMYEEAVRENKTAVLLSSARPDIFQLRVGQLAPGAECEVRVSYVVELPVEEASTRLELETKVQTIFRNHGEGPY